MKLNKLFGIYTFTLILLSTISVCYLLQTGSHTESLNKKIEFVKLTGLPDLSIVTSASYIRHRSLSNINDIFYISPEVISLFPAEFIYSPNRIKNNE
jgi:hypothetical protein